MILLADIGNTDITLGSRSNDRTQELVRTPTEPDNRAAGRYASALKKAANGAQPPEGVVLCSVVPAATVLLKEAVMQTFSLEPMIVTHDLRTGLTFTIDNAAELGADRIANAAAARHLYEGNLIVVDFGTATTVCMVTASGEYRGGAILPGAALCARALSDRTAKLPAVTLAKPSRVLGKTPQENIISGIVVGHAGAVEKIITMMKSETALDCRVLATGGLFGMIQPFLESVDEYNPLLTLEGLRIIYELNS
jgi:type III pantothenate kinase